VEVQARPFEIQREPHALGPLLVDLARAAGAQPGDTHAVTMTAELSQIFRTKREGVGFVLDQVVAAFPDACIRVHTVDGRFIDAAAAREAPLEVAAANWAATARRVAQSWPDGILIDVGSTTTDITPIVAGAIAARGRTDPERLREGELVYSGALRTPVEAIAPTVPLWGGNAGVAAEGFAVAGDVHLWRGHLAPGDYSAPTPDGRPATREFAGERLARVVCADREMLDEGTISAIADSLWEAQVDRITSAIARIVHRHATLARGPAIVTGLGISGGGSLSPGRASDRPPVGALGPRGAARPRGSDRVAARRQTRNGDHCAMTAGRTGVETIVKVGGGLLSRAGAFELVTGALAEFGKGRRLLVVPGGGPFAQAVRELVRRVKVGDEAAHWMAVLGMDQYAHALTERTAGSVLVEQVPEVHAALDAGLIPVLAPYRWLHAADPLPHSWNATSDSVAAWVAGEVGATRIALIKPAKGETSSMVDPLFLQTLPPGVDCVVLTAHEMEKLGEVLDQSSGTRQRRAAGNG
jgi:probable H4MPT-linked C1 transfer pathway protein